MSSHHHAERYEELISGSIVTCVKTLQMQWLAMIATEAMQYTGGNKNKEARRSAARQDLRLYWHW